MEVDVMTEGCNGNLGVPLVKKASKGGRHRLHWNT